uniref:Uncharacterized protein n=1 Tax=Iridovirus LCIVAC01 TaxID=2506607 RepID=A0A481YQN4_9VIRU|nr:MAG: hypothetical protein LCIVAC01_00890 [Iridovirus LCIVAC01]
MNEEFNNQNSEKEEEKKEDIPCPYYDIILDLYDRNVSFEKLNPELFGKLKPGLFGKLNPILLNRGLFGNLNPRLFGNILLIKYILRNQKRNTEDRQQTFPLIENRDIIDNYLSNKSSQNPEEEWEIINESNSEQ